MSRDKIVSLSDRAKEVEDLKKNAFNRSLDKMCNDVKADGTGEALYIYYANKNDRDSLQFASNTDDVERLHWMLTKAAQHLMDYGYGDPEDS